jgi:hypothetical protein
VLVICRYELHVADGVHSSDEDPVLTMFGEVNVPFWTAIFTWRYPVEDADGNQLTTIERLFGTGVQVSCLALFIHSFISFLLDFS